MKRILSLLLVLSLLLPAAAFAEDDDDLSAADIIEEEVILDDDGNEVVVDEETGEGFVITSADQDKLDDLTAHYEVDDTVDPDTLVERTVILPHSFENSSQVPISLEPMNILIPQFPFTISATVSPYTLLSCAKD